MHCAGGEGLLIELQKARVNLHLPDYLQKFVKTSKCWAKRSPALLSTDCSSISAQSVQSIMFSIVQLLVEAVG